MKLILKLSIIITMLVTIANAAELTGTLKKINDTNKINIGIRESSVPFSYLDANQKPIGYAIDICMVAVDSIKAKLKKPNLEIVFTPVTSQTRIPLVTNGTIDLECGSTTNSLERQKQVAFSYTYFIIDVKLVVKAKSGIENYKDLSGKTVVTTIGSTSDKYIKQMEADGILKGTKILYAKDHAESFLMVQTNRADAFMMDDILLAGLIATSGKPSDYKIVGDSFRTEPYAVMIRKDDPEFKKLLDDSLGALYKSKRITSIYNKWFTSAIPPKNINLNMPIGAKLKAAFAKPTDQGVE